MVDNPQKPDRRRFLGMVGAAAGGVGALAGMSALSAVSGSPAGAHDILSVTHNDALPASVIAGDLLYGNATPKWARLPKGTDDYILRLVAGLPTWVSAPYVLKVGDNLTGTLRFRHDAGILTEISAENVAGTLQYGVITSYVGAGPGGLNVFQLAAGGGSVVYLGGVYQIEATGTTSFFGTSTQPFNTGYADNFYSIGLRKRGAGALSLFLDYYQRLKFQAAQNEGGAAVGQFWWSSTLARLRIHDGVSVKSLPTLSDALASFTGGGINDTQHGVRTLANAHAHTDLSGVTADQHHAQLHKAAHVSGGGDAFISTDIVEAVVKRIRETVGPTNLDFGAIADGEFLKRSGLSIIGGAGGGGGAPTDADYLVGTANPGLSAEIVVGTTPGGELGGTWAAPTIDSIHAGSAHHAQDHTLTSHTTRTHSELTDVLPNQHHNEDHKARHVSAGADAFISTDIVEAVVKRIRETGTPTILDFGAIPDGSFLKRNLATVIGESLGFDDLTGSITDTQHGSRGSSLHTDSHIRLHTLSDALDHSGSITDAQHGVRTLASAHAHSALSGIGVNDHHAQSHTLTSHSTRAHSELTSVGADDHHAQLHKASHVSGGGDTFISSDIVEAVVKRIRETAGPTNLDFGAIADGQFLQRSGTGIVGGSAGGAPTDADYLVGSAQPGLSAEIVVGLTPGGELGGTWAAPTIDSVHSGSAHHTENHKTRHAVGGADAFGSTEQLRVRVENFLTMPPFDATEKGRLLYMVGDGGPGYAFGRVTYVDDNGNDAALPIMHDELLAVQANQHHAQLHAAAHALGSGDALPSIGQSAIEFWSGGTIKTNIGTVYVDIWYGSGVFFNEYNALIDTTGATQFRLIFTWARMGTGTQQCRWVRNSDALVLWESLTFVAHQLGTDSGWVNIPAGLLNASFYVRMQGKSTVATDDPAAYGYKIMLR